MDSESVFVGVWLVSLLLLVGTVVWWHWFTNEPKWFIAAGLGVLVVLVLAISLLASGQPLWMSWVATAAALVGLAASVWGASRR